VIGPFGVMCAPLSRPRAWCGAVPAVAVLLCAACGMKGPPLPPLANVPSAPTQVSALRTGDQVTIRFTIPRTNMTGMQPANIERVDVYAWSGRSLTPQQLYKVAKVVASVPVRPPPPPPPDVKPGKPPPPPPPPPTGPGLDQGAAAEVIETLTPESFQPVDVPEKKTKPVPVAEVQLTPPDVALPVEPPLTRYYIVVGVNRHGSKGPGAQRVGVPLWTAPPLPIEAKAAVRERGVDIVWTAPAGLRQPIGPAVPVVPAKGRQDRQGTAPGTAAPGSRPPGAPDGAPAENPVSPPHRDDADTSAPPSSPRTADRGSEAAATPRGGAAVPAAARDRAATESGVTAPATPSAGQADGAGSSNDEEASKLLPSRVPAPWLQGSSGFKVYEVAPPDAASNNAAPLPAAQTFPLALTASPLKNATFTDARIEFGSTRCYVVRTVEILGTLSMESPSTEPVCVKPVDLFPPAAPRSLGIVASEGAISLIWEASAEPDLGGYIVLRGESPGDRLDPVTPAPIRETTYRDTTVKTGVRYVYAVIAVDNAKPPNRSELSNRVEETAR
jgi:hypothetical protein